MTRDPDHHFDIRPLILDASSREELFAAVAAVSGGDPRQVIDALEAREAEGSTAVVRGLALPHGEVAGMEHAILFDVRLARAMAWAANDDAVERCFCVVFPKDRHAECADLLAEAARRVANGE